MRLKRYRSILPLEKAWVRRVWSGYSEPFAVRFRLAHRKFMGILELFSELSASVYWYVAQRSLATSFQAPCMRSATGIGFAYVICLELLGALLQNWSYARIASTTHRPLSSIPILICPSIHIYRMSEEAFEIEVPSKPNLLYPERFHNRWCDLDVSEEIQQKLEDGTFPWTTSRYLI